MNNKNILSCPQHWYSRPVNVVLVGCGGTGSEMLDALHRIHICLQALEAPGLHVTVFDHDDVAAHNIGRQRFWKDDVGCNKAVVSVQRINFCNGFEWQGVPFSFKPEVLSELSCDLLITAADNGKLRFDIGAMFAEKSSNGLWLDAGVGGTEGQVILGHLGQADKGKIPNVFDLYREGLLTREEVEEKPVGCASLAASLAAQGLFVNRTASDIMGDLLFNLIRHGETPHHGSFFSIDPIEVRPLKIDAQIWQSFGYKAA